MPVEFLAHLVKGTEEDPVFYAFVTDITERKRAEEQRLEMERRLLHAQKLESLGVLAGGIAHDFNNILAGVMGYADLALQRLPAAEPAAADIAEIKRAAQRAADLTRQLLAYSGRGTFLLQPTCLSRSVEELRRMLEMSCSKKAELKYNLGADLPAIQADPAQINQVIMNLVINASEALGEEGGAISISTAALQCSREDLANVALGQGLAAGLYVRLEVADTGCGMDQQTLAKIFDPFFTTKFTGRGLGLAAIQGIVRSHRGAIRAASEPGKGTAFQVLFPACDASPPPAARERAGANPWRGAGTVLVVDDEEMVRSLASRMLKHLGFSVLTAKDGQEALAQYRQRQREIVCVLLDLTMPKMNGEETFRELRRLCPTAPVILSSGYSQEDVTERFAGLDVTGVMQKPYQLDVMRERFRAALGDRLDDDDATAAPRLPPQNEAFSAAAPALRASSKDLVLVVDDDKMVREATRVTFGLAGFTVLTAGDGAEAIRLFRPRQAEIVCVFLDLSMPKMNGLEVLRELRAIRADVRVILASGYGEGDVTKRLAGQSVWRIFHKLDPLDELVSELCKALAAR